MSNRPPEQNGSWQDRVTQLEFSDSEADTLKVLAESDHRSIEDVLANLCVDNCSIKAKSVDYYGCYTISYTLDKHHPKMAGHTFWFYAQDLVKGIKVMSAFVESMLPDIERVPTKQNAMRTLW